LGRGGVGSFHPSSQGRGDSSHPEESFVKPSDAELSLIAQNLDPHMPARSAEHSVAVGPQSREPVHANDREPTSTSSRSCAFAVCAKSPLYALSRLTPSSPT